MTDHPWLEFAAPYALGALGVAERAEFEAHLADCGTCRGEVQSFREVAGLLVYAAPAASPAPALRDRVLAEARRVRPIGRGPALPWLAVAASLVLAMGVGYGYWRAQGAQDELVRALAAAQDTIAARDSLVATLLSPDVGTAALAATGRPPSARLYWNRPRHTVVVAVFDLPPAPAGRTYQLWGIPKDKGKPPVSLGVFNTQATGRATLTLTVPAGLQLQLSAVTEEPTGGSPHPTQQPFLVGAWQGI